MEHRHYHYQDCDDYDDYGEYSDEEYAAYMQDEEQIEAQLIYTIHYNRNDKHFSEFLFEIWLYELAAAIPKNKASIPVNFEVLTFCTQTAIGRMKEYDAHLDSPFPVKGNRSTDKNRPFKVFDMYIATAPYALSPADVYLYLKDEWRVSRLFTREIGIDRTQTDPARYPTAFTLPALTQQDHDHFWKTYSKINPAFLDRFANIVYGCRQWVWSNNGSGGDKVKMSNNQWGIHKYTKEFNTQRLKDIADAEAEALIASLAEEDAQKSKAASKKLSKKARKAKKAAAAAVAEGNEPQLPSGSDTASGQPSSVSSSSLSAEPPAPPTEEQIDMALDTALTARSELRRQMEHMDGLDREARGGLASAWLLQNLIVMRTALKTFNIAEEKRRIAVEKARQKAISEAKRRGQTATKIKMICSSSLDFNTRQIMIRKQVEKARLVTVAQAQKSMSKGTAKTVKGKPRSTKSSPSVPDSTPAATSSQPSPSTSSSKTTKASPSKPPTKAEKELIEVFLDEYVRVVATKLQPFAPGPLQYMLMGGIMNEIEPLFMASWDCSKTMRANVNAFLDASVGAGQVTSADARSLMQYYDEIPTDRKKWTPWELGGFVAGGIGAVGMGSRTYGSWGVGGDDGEHYKSPFSAFDYSDLDSDFEDEGCGCGHDHSDGSVPDWETATEDEASDDDEVDSEDVPDCEIVTEDEDDEDVSDDSDVPDGESATDEDDDSDDDAGATPGRAGDGRTVAQKEAKGAVHGNGTMDKRSFDAGSTHKKSKDEEDERNRKRELIEREKRARDAEADKHLIQLKMAREQRVARNVAEAAAEAQKVVDERLKAEEVVAERDAKTEAERVAKAEAERVAKAKAEAERVAKAKAETERVAKAKAEAERVAKAKAEAERVAKAKAEAERVVKAEAERAAKTAAQRAVREKAEQERLAREEAARLVKENAERLAKEKAEQERLGRFEAARLAREKADRLAREESDRLASEEADRLAREESDRLARDEAERAAEKVHHNVGEELDKDQYVGEMNESFQNAMGLPRSAVEEITNRILRERANRDELAEAETTARLRNEQGTEAAKVQAALKVSRNIQVKLLGDKVDAATREAERLLALASETEGAARDARNWQNIEAQCSALKAKCSQDNAAIDEERARQQAYSVGENVGLAYDETRKAQKQQEAQVQILEMIIEKLRGPREVEGEAGADVQARTVREAEKSLILAAEQAAKALLAAQNAQVDAENELRKETRRLEHEVRLQAERVKEEKKLLKRLGEMEVERVRAQIGVEANAVAKIRREPVRLPNDDAVYYDWRGINIMLSLWMVPTAAPLRQMDALVRRYDAKLRPSEEMMLTRHHVLETLQLLFDIEFPDAGLQLMPFGSYVTGLGNTDSDIDICVYAEHYEPLAAHSDVVHLASILRLQGFVDVRAIPDAKVPIVKFVDPHTGIACDMNVQHPLGIYNSALIKAYLDIDARLGSFLYLLKHFAKVHGILDASSGYLCSYAFILMAIVFFQEQKEPILPRLQSKSEKPKNFDENKKRRPAVPSFGALLMDRTLKPTFVHQDGKSYEVSYDTRTELYKSYGILNTKSVARLLFEFFEYFARLFDYRTMEVSPMYGRFQERHVLAKERRQQLALDKLSGASTAGYASGSFPRTSAYTFDSKRQLWVSEVDKAYFQDLDSNNGLPSGAVPIPGSPEATVDSMSASATAAAAAAAAASTRVGYQDRFGSDAFFCVMDPFMLKRNVAGTCRGTKLAKVWRCFDHAYRCLALGQFEEAFKPLPEHSTGV
ncbi:hypothetical protein BGZ72_005626 [Mortierella alpina]|nr:hypothetical protein BGZ72_005626 [Mortierella alpina]